MSDDCGDNSKRDMTIEDLLEDLPEEDEFKSEWVIFRNTYSRDNINAACHHIANGDCGWGYRICSYEDLLEDLPEEDEFESEWVANGDCGWGYRICS